ncbi:ATP-dependent DNA helicase [Bacillus sp. T3]|uniref:ATP-dependent DNA helicase n=1 Tax=Bacillus sp. T3 TaxID=467262 RepID=UPI002980D201|nr:ATP-dependent DNA helicase [Bacillus sp. T3]
MKWLIAPLLFFSNWYYIPLESPSNPVEINNIDLNLKNEEVAFTFFSLSDGEASLIQQPDGKNVLINTGGENTKEEFKKLLALYHVHQIDTIILTDTGKCCFENISWLMKDFHVKRLMSPKDTEKNINEFLYDAEAVDYRSLSKGMNHEILPGLVMVVLNDTKGLDLSISFLNRRILWMNHASPNIDYSTPRNEAVETTIIKLPDLASMEVLSEDFFEQLDPEFAILFRKKEENVNEDLLEQLQQAWVRVYYNKNIGAVSVKFTEDNYEIVKISNKKK